MTNIDVRKNVEPPAQVATPAHPMREWDPGRWMRSLLTWDPFREMAPFTVAERELNFMPAFEVKETKDAYLFKADVPGVRREDIEVNLTGNRLTITGKRDSEKHEKTDTVYAYERSYGSFTRAFTMPEGINENAIVADLRDGVLTINVAKKPEAMPKKIAVNTPQEKKS